jgi:hypothetical protein
MSSNDEKASQPINWMLQSPHVSGQELAYALIERYYRTLYALALACFKQGDIARQVAVEALAKAVSSRQVVFPI